MGKSIGGTLVDHEFRQSGFSRPKKNGAFRPPVAHANRKARQTRTRRGQRLAQQASKAVPASGPTAEVATELPAQDREIVGSRIILKAASADIYDSVRPVESAKVRAAIQVERGPPERAKIKKPSVLESLVRIAGQACVPSALLKLDDGGRGAARPARPG